MTYEMPEPCDLHESHGSHAHGEDWCPGYTSPSAETWYGYIPPSTPECACDWWLPRPLPGGPL